MKKLKLESIHVESYEMSAAAAEVGTVQANAATIISCGGSCRTCDVTNCTCESGPICC
jgi:hypothetical protein